MRATRMLAALLAAHPAGDGVIGTTKTSPSLLNSDVDPGIGPYRYVKQGGHGVMGARESIRMFLRNVRIDRPRGEADAAVNEKRLR